MLVPGLILIYQNSFMCSRPQRYFFCLIIFVLNKKLKIVFFIYLAFFFYVKLLLLQPQISSREGQGYMTVNVRHTLDLELASLPNHIYTDTRSQEADSQGKSQISSQIILWHFLLLPWSVSESSIISECNKERKYLEKI